MSHYGVNVPPGIPVFKQDEVLPAAQKMADDEGQVRAWLLPKQSSGLAGPHICMAAQGCMVCFKGACFASPSLLHACMI